MPVEDIVPSRLPVPVLVVLLAALGAADVVLSTAPAEAVDEDVQIAPMPDEIPVDALLTGPGVRRSADVGGVQVALRRGEADALEVVLANPGDAPIHVDALARVTRTDGMMVSRMGPIAMNIAEVPVKLVVAAGDSTSVVLAGVTLPPAEMGGLLSFSTTAVQLGDGPPVVFVDGQHGVLGSPEEEAVVSEVAVASTRR